MDKFLDGIKVRVQSGMRMVAKVLNRLSRGKLTPNTVTVIGLLAHLPIAWLIAEQHYLWAALLLVIFGLFDSLDGALARLQDRATPFGMLLDTVTDRMKEIILYIGIGLSFVYTGHAEAAVWAIAACGGSLLISFINAWGEVTLIKHRPKDEHGVNQTFRSGLMRFEIRMFALVIGLVFNQLIFIVGLLAILTFYTALQRINTISERLNTDVKD